MTCTHNTQRSTITRRRNDHHRKPSRCNRYTTTTKSASNRIVKYRVRTKLCLFPSLLCSLFYSTYTCHTTIVSFSTSCTCACEAFTFPYSNKDLFIHQHNNHNHNPIPNSRLRIKHSSQSTSSSHTNTIHKYNTHYAIPPSLTDIFQQLPFQDMGKNLMDQLDIGASFYKIPEASTAAVLESMGRDLLVFLTASVIITPIATALGISPILGYLMAGALLGPHAWNVFSNTKADVELGDFGILFLLFSEGLEVSKSRFANLTKYLPLGFAQMSLTAGVLSAAILLGGPEFLERFIPLDGGLINIHNPIEALVLALAGTLSTSAFVFPVLKEKEWEEEASGEAATSVLLLQDLAVAPLLVFLPFLAGSGTGGQVDFSAISFLTAKATIGFGAVIALGSFVLERLFRTVAKARSTETFVSLCLLVSVGMGSIAKSLGLTDTAGAFAAGVLLANTNYRAQIQADILPFKGILLGIFFMDAGSSFDMDLVLSEFPTIVTGALALVALKAVTLFLATKVPEWLEPHRLPQADAVKLSLLLAGGGEFAFVVTALAEKLNILPKDLDGILTAIVLITMAITPILGELADVASEKLRSSTKESAGALASMRGALEGLKVSSDAVVICGYGEIGQNVLRIVDQNRDTLPAPKNLSDESLPRIAVFDCDPSLLDREDHPSKSSVVLFGDGSNPEVIKSSGVVNPSAIFVCYHDHSRVISATSRLRIAFPKSPIYARAQTRVESQSLEAAGATEVVVEADELPRSAIPLLRGQWTRSIIAESTPEEFQLAVAKAAGSTVNEVKDLLQFFKCLDVEEKGVVSQEDLIYAVRNSNVSILTDDEIREMEVWINSVVTGPVNTVDFCRLYVNAPDNVKCALSDACIL